MVDPATVIVTHMTELLKKYGWEVLTRVEVQNILDNVSKAYPKIVEELIPSVLPLGTVQRVLQNLLRERVPIKDIVTILETLLDYGVNVKDPEILTEHVRESLARVITKQYTLPDGTVPIYTLDPRLEREIIQNIGEGTSISPHLIQRLMKGLEKILNDERLKSIQPIVVCSPQVRRHLRKIMERIMPSVVVISSNEISSDAKLFSMGTVSYED